MLETIISSLSRKKSIREATKTALVSGPFIAAITMITPQLVHAEVRAEMAGVSAAVTGEITLSKVTGEVGILVESGMPVYLGDRIITSANAGMQVLLLDETVLTIGPNSDIAIDEFVYDPATGKGRIVADMAKGVMRFVTGKIPLNTPSSMDINLPVGSIGIRGTIGLIRSMTAEQANQIVPGSFDTEDTNTENRLVFMAVNQGPGISRNDTMSRPGAFAAFNQNGGVQNVTGENFGVFVSNNTVTQPTRFPINAATFDFSAHVVHTASLGTSSDSGTTSTSASSANQQPVITRQQTGQAQNQTGSTSAQAIEVAMAQIGTVNSASNVTETISTLHDNTRSSEGSSNSSSVSSSAFTYDGLRQVTSGSATTGTLNISGGGISYDFSTTIDYANRTINVSFSNINDGVESTGSASFTGFDYSGSSGNVTFDNDAFSYNSACNTMDCVPSTTFTDATNVNFNVKTTNVPNGNASSGTLN